MADLVPQNFPLPTSNITASYDFSEVSTGLGFETYYAVRTKTRINEANDEYVNLLSSISNVFPTDVKISQTAVASTTFNFDTSTFNLARTARGIAIFNAVLTNEEADNQECIVYVQLFRVDSQSVATAMSSQIAWKRTDQVGGAPDASLSPGEEENMLIYLTLTETVLGIGEKIRLAVTLQMISGSGTDTMNVYCDPQDRTILSNTDVSSQMKVHVPFRIEN